MNTKVLVLNGPNLNLLGNRENNHYGTLSLETINNMLKIRASKHNCDIIFYQSNVEGEIVSKIHDAINLNIDYIIINPAAYTHTSIAIRDAIIASKIKTIEVHLSNISNREAFRQISYISDIAIGTISGFKEQSYVLALDYIIQQSDKGI